MKNPARRITVIDRQEYWRLLSVRTLEEAGYVVTPLDTYDYDFGVSSGAYDQVDLVILGCATIGPEEHDLIGHILDHKHQLVVLSTSIPSRVMRSVFLLGAKDVADKSYNPEALVLTVETVLKDVEPRSTYERFAQEGPP